MLGNRNPVIYARKFKGNKGEETRGIPDGVRWGSTDIFGHGR